jgi:hypothetical protein
MTSHPGPSSDFVEVSVTALATAESVCPGNPFLHHSQIARQGQFETAGDRRTGDCGNDGVAQDHAAGAHRSARCRAAVVREVEGGERIVLAAEPAGMFSFSHTKK